MARGGKRAGSGRPKGSVSPVTALLKDAILQAADEAGGKEGLVGYLKVQAEANPSAFMGLLGKVLPTQVAGDPSAPVVLEVSWKEPSES